MRISWWGCCLAAALLLMGWGAYQHVNQPTLPTVPPGASEQSEQRPLDRSPEQPVAEKDDGRLQQADAAPQSPEQPVAEQQADAAPQRPEQPVVEKDDDRLQQADAAQRPEQPVAEQQADAAPQRPEQPVVEKDDDRLQQADAAQRPEQPVAEQQADAPTPRSEQPVAKQQADAAPQRPEPPVVERDDSRLQQADVAATPDVQRDQLPRPQKEARLDDAANADAAEGSEPGDTRGKLSYLHYYAYSEIPPATKPADTVLNALKDIPPGTPIEEIRRVANLLGMDFNFLKTIAKIESGFDPKQRTGSYIGLFQLSRYEFKKHGSGDILDARDNAVAAALKMMNEAVLFQMFTRKKTTQFDLYLIHQQGIEGAAEHLSHPRRLAWRSMCRTQEGKEKGDRWCKLAIWGNTLPAFKRTWKSVNKVTSGDFVAMWQQRVSQFYGRYSQSASAID